MNGMEPCRGILGPMRNRKLCGAQPISVTALRKNMQLCRHLCLLERLKVKQGVLLVHRIVFRLYQKRRRSVRGRLYSLGHLTGMSLVPQVSRINDECEIGMRIKVALRHSGTLKVRVVAEHSRQVRAGRESKHSHQ